MIGSWRCQVQQAEPALQQAVTSAVYTGKLLGYL